MRCACVLAFAPPAAAQAAHEAAADGLLPLLLPLDLRLTPEQFALVSEANPDAVLERPADGQRIAMTPSGGETGVRHFNLSLALGLAAAAGGAVVGRMRLGISRGSALISGSCGGRSAAWAFSIASLRTSSALPLRRAHRIYPSRARPQNPTPWCIARVALAGGGRVMFAV